MSRNKIFVEWPMVSEEWDLEPLAQSTSVHQWSSGPNKQWYEPNDEFSTPIWCDQKFIEIWIHSFFIVLNTKKYTKKYKIYLLNKL